MEKAEIRDIRRVLESLIGEFEKIQNYSSEVYCMKVVVPAGTNDADMAKVWLRWLTKAKDKSCSRTDYKRYQLNEQEEVSIALGGKNITEGWYALDSPMKRVATRLLLGNYDYGEMPDCDEFLDKFAEFDARRIRNKTPWHRLSTDEVGWVEFLFKVAEECDELRYHKYKDLYDKSVPCVVKLMQTLETDMRKASISALNYLLGKAKQARGTKKPEPLSKNAQIVYEILVELPPQKALTASEILDKVADKHKKYWDEKELYNRVFPQLKEWGLKNKPRIGYWIEKQ